MPSHILTEAPDFALLSAASAGAEIDNAGLMDVGGEPFIFHQINALRNFGIKNFLVEVDAIPGALLSLADACSKDGCTLEFVRSAQEIVQKMQPGGRLIVTGEGVFASSVVLDQVVSASAPTLFTLDGRDENAAFERIDLNTRWTGLAVVDLATIQGLETLPEGWSIASSILRHMLQLGNARQISLKQKAVQEGDIILVNSQAGIDSVTNRMLQHRIARLRGVIEKYVFAPLSVRIATRLWRVDAPPAALLWSTLGLCGAMVLFAALNWPISAAVIAFCALFFNVLRETEKGPTRLRFGAVGTDELLSASGISAMLVLMWSANHSLIEILLPVTAISSAMLVASRLKMSGILGAFLQSKAAVALGLIALVPFAGTVSAMKVLSLAYLLVLSTAIWREKKN